MDLLLARIAELDGRDILALLSALIAIFSILLGYCLNVRTLRASRANADAAIWQKANEAELKEIQARLDTFFGPYEQLSKVNQLLARDLRSRQPDSDRFILLEKLFDEGWMIARPAGEKALIDELAANAVALRELIAAQSGAVDATIVPYLARASAHYRIIELATAGRLGKDGSEFVAKYVYPKSVDDVVNLERKRLETRAAALRALPASAHMSAAPLGIPDEYALKDWVNPPRAARPELTGPISG